MKRQWLCAIAIGVLLWGAGENFRKDSKLWKTWKWNKLEIGQAYKQISAAMDGSQSPRILYLYSLDYGFGLWHDGLPAGKYWTRQTGSTKDMDRWHETLLEISCADYIIINDEPKTYAMGIPPGKILSCGYSRVFRIEYTNLGDAVVRTAVYKKNEPTVTNVNGQWDAVIRGREVSRAGDGDER